MDETNMSFAAVAKAIPLVWGMLIVEPMPKEYNISSFSATSAFMRLDHMDAADAAARKAAEDSCWGFAADAGNKGTAVNMVAVSVWDAAKGMPRTEPLACTALDSDQSAANSAETVNLALAASGLRPGRCVHGMSDGADAAKQEAAQVVNEQHRRHVAALRQAEARRQQPEQAQRRADDDDSENDELGAQPRPAARPPLRVPQTSTTETCCIHAKALEERAFIDGGFPLFIDGLRILWEIMKSPEGGRLEQYRVIWSELGLVAQVFHNSIAKVRRKRGGGGGGGKSMGIPSVTFHIKSLLPSPLPRRRCQSSPQQSGAV